MSTWVVIGVDGMDEARWRDGSPVGVLLSSVSAFESDDGNATPVGGAEAGISISSTRDTASARPSNESSDRSESSSENVGSADSYFTDISIVPLQ